MLKLTVVGRVSDGLPLAKGPRYVNEENSDFSTYKELTEFLLKEISKGALPPSRMTIFLDHLYFMYMVENGICFVALCDALYPRKLAFCYLQDLRKEFEEFDLGLIERIIRPYAVTKFDGIIGNIRRKYVDTRTQTNLSKINSVGFPEEDIVSESLSQIVKRRQRFEMFERMSKVHLHTSTFWCSKRLEVIATKWIPLGLVLAVTAVLVWASLHRMSSIGF